LQEAQEMEHQEKQEAAEHWVREELEVREWAEQEHVEREA